MHGLGVYTWKIGDKYIGEVRAALRRLSGPAEDSCLSLARLRRTWPAACSCLAQVQRTYAPQHGMRRPRSAARGVVARVERRSVRVAWAPACATCLCDSRAPLSRRCSLGGSTASARTRGARTASTWGSGRKARCMGMASRPTRQVRACDVVEEATGGGGGSAPQCALLCAWHVWRGYIAAHGARVRHLRDARLGRRGLAHSARAACAPARTPASCLLALSTPPPRRIAAPPPRRQATSSRAIGRRASRSSRTPRAKTGPTYYPGSTRR